MYGEEEYSEFGETVDRGYRGVSSGPGASLDRAIEQAAKEAARAGHAGEELIVTAITVVPLEHNQWVRVFSATVSGG
jgi:hypothetical protein